MRKLHIAASIVAGGVALATIAGVDASSGPPPFLWTDGACIATGPVEAQRSDWSRLDLTPHADPRHGECLALGANRAKSPRLMESFTAAGPDGGGTRRDTVFRRLAALLPWSSPPLRSGSLGCVTVEPRAATVPELAEYAPVAGAAPVLDTDGVAWVRCELVSEAQ